MPGKHAKGTKLIGLYAERLLVQKLDEDRDYTSRSDYLRDAVVEYMQRRGKDVPDHLRRPADRTGKGGGKRGKK